MEEESNEPQENIVEDSNNEAVEVYTEEASAEQLPETEDSSEPIVIRKLPTGYEESQEVFVQQKVEEDPIFHKANEPSIPQVSEGETPEEVFDASAEISIVVKRPVDENGQELFNEYQTPSPFSADQPLEEQTDESAQLKTQQEEYDDEPTLLDNSSYRIVEPPEYVHEPTYEHTSETHQGDENYSDEDRIKEPEQSFGRQLQSPRRRYRVKDDSPSSSAFAEAGGGTAYQKIKFVVHEPNSPTIESQPDYASASSKQPIMISEPSSPREITPPRYLLQEPLSPSSATDQQLCEFNENNIDGLSKTPPRKPPAPHRIGKQKLVNTAPAVSESSPSAYHGQAIIQTPVVITPPTSNSARPSPRGNRPSPYPRKRSSTSGHGQAVVYSPPIYKHVEPTNELQRLKEKAKREEPLTGASIELLQELLYILNQERKNLAREHRYKEGLKYNTVIAHVNKYILQAQKLENQVKQQELFSPIKKDFEEQLARFDNETKALERGLIEKQKQQRETLVRNHQIERDEFDARWASSKKQRIYNKSTTTLIQLRRQLNFLLVQSRFDEAEEVQKIIKERMKSEAQDHHEIMQRDFDESLALLKNKQKEEIITFEENCEVQSQKLRQDREKLRRGYLNRQLKLRVKEEMLNDPDKLWAHAQKDMLDEAVKNSAKNSTNLPPTRIKSEEIEEKDVTVLELPPLDNRRKQRSGKVSE
ncbi:hypothetical protein TRFO_14903 [Tritrichomonas foetus]|uniref:Uncharacterized protein n=1 Tax=Tritrichomonas foetus TaxID=1144522 RepID=A0A1J4KTN4_9EUKA|nr:hypothetical protein TRFO_14903 [Tritrichomonas foetus]|eukprot:OHT14619.1 hypothetical protein TRFO_14903 [Tritrichomonas foetus]